MGLAFSLTFFSLVVGGGLTRALALYANTHTHTFTTGEKNGKGNKWRGSNESLSSNVEFQVFITRSLPLGADLIPPFPDFQFDFAG